VRRILLDENLPRRLKQDLRDFEVRTVQEERWTSYANGSLLRRAEETFDVFLTADRRLRFQQNVPNYGLGIVVILTHSLRYGRIVAAIGDIRAAIERVTPGNVVEVDVKTVRGPATR
jgi:hypothetical protein